MMRPGIQTLFQVKARHAAELDVRNQEIRFRVIRVIQVRFR
jgi:hypothetical protein